MKTDIMERPIVGNGGHREMESWIVHRVKKHKTILKE